MDGEARGALVVARGLLAFAVVADFRVLAVEVCASFLRLALSVVVDGCAAAADTGGAGGAVGTAANFKKDSSRGHSERSIRTPKMMSPMIRRAPAKDCFRMCSISSGAPPSLSRRGFVRCFAA